jgi:hypothetical protein
MLLRNFSAGVVRSFAKIGQRAQSAAPSPAPLIGLSFEERHIHTLIQIIDTFSHAPMDRLGVQRYTLAQLASEWHIKYADSITDKLLSDVPFRMEVSSGELKILRHLITMVLDMLQEGEVPAPSNEVHADLLTIYCTLHTAGV